MHQQDVTIKDTAFYKLATQYLDSIDLGDYADAPKDGGLYARQNGNWATAAKVNHSHGEADQSNSGFMSASDKVTLDLIDSYFDNDTLDDKQLSAAVKTSLGKADTASQPGHTHSYLDVNPSISTFFDQIAATSVNVAQIAGATQQTVDQISPGLHLTRGLNGFLYNPLIDSAPAYNEQQEVATNAEWNVDGWTNLENVGSRTFITNLPAYVRDTYGVGQFPTFLLNTPLILKDTTTGLFHKVQFTAWGGNVGATNYPEFAYTRTPLTPAIKTFSEIGHTHLSSHITDATDAHTRGTLVKRNGGDGSVTLEILTILSKSNPFPSAGIIPDIYQQGEDAVAFTSLNYFDTQGKPNIYLTATNTQIDDLVTSQIFAGAGNRLWNLQAGSRNLVIGGNNQSDSTVLGSANTILGSNAGSNLPGGANKASNCVFVGAYAGAFCAKTNITAVGYYAYHSGTGSACVAIGSQSLNQTTGSNNVGVGNNTGNALTTGGNNTCIGSQAGATTLTTGSNNTLIGQAANVGASNRSLGIALGYRATTDATLDGTFHIGGSGNYAMPNLTTNTAPTGASTFLRIWLNGTEYRIQAQAA